MRKLFLLLIVLVSMLAFQVKSEARIFRWSRRQTTTSSRSSWPTSINSSDQTRAQYKANIMASRGVMSHGVAPLVGSFEGIGHGSSRNCGTCTPSRGMRLTADAAAFGHGMWYRVRAWR